MFNKILVPVDNSQLSWSAFNYALELGKKFGCKIVVAHVVYVVPTSFEFMPLSDLLSNTAKELEKESVGMFDKAKKLAGNFKLSTALKFGTPYEKILEICQEESCDLIVMGSKGQSTLSGLLAGSTAFHVFHHAKCAVLTVRK